MGVAVHVCLLPCWSSQTQRGGVECVGGVEWQDRVSLFSSPLPSNGSRDVGGEARPMPPKRGTFCFPSSPRLWGCPPPKKNKIFPLAGKSLQISSHNLLGLFEQRRLLQKRQVPLSIATNRLTERIIPRWGEVRGPWGRGAAPQKRRGNNISLNVRSQGEGGKMRGPWFSRLAFEEGGTSLGPCQLPVRLCPELSSLFICSAPL